MREGIDDLRYVATLTRALEQLPHDHDLRRRIEPQLRDLLGNYINPDYFWDPDRMHEYRPGKFNTDRLRVAEWILAVRAAGP